MSVRRDFWSLRQLAAAVGGAALAACLLLGPGPAAEFQVEPTEEDLKQNRQMLEGYRKEEPAHYARLRRDLNDFLKLPAERQAQLRQLDREVHEEGSSTAYRLLEAMARYVDWLDRLPPAERQEIDRAPNRDERLATIRKLRDREWVQRLPAAVREQIAKVAEDARPALLHKIRQEERERRAPWRVAIRHWDDAVIRGNPQPTRLEELRGDVQAFVVNVLMPMLSDEEKKRLMDAEGQWPDYPRRLVELADKHPVRLLGPLTGPRNFQELPPEMRNALPATFRKNPPPAVKAAEGKWPDYLIAVADYAARNKGKKEKEIILPTRLYPCRPEHFTKPIQQFIDRRLFPVLSPAEKKQLHEAQGNWPRYPKLVLELARKYKLEVPGHTLPGPRGWWDSYRTSGVIDSLPGAYASR